MAVPTRRSHGWTRLADVPIHAKVSLAPGLILLALLLLAFASLRSLDAGKARLDAISLQAFPTYQHAAEAKDGVNAIQAALQHTLSVAANESDVARIRNLAIPVLAAVTRAAGAIDRLQQQIGSRTEAIAALRQWFESYQAAATEVLTIAETDLATATMLMADADEQFAKLSSELDGFKNRADAASQALSNDAMQAADSDRFVLVSVTGVATIVCIGIMVAIARAIGRPVQKLTGTLAVMADADLNREVRALGRGDEIYGEIAAVSSAAAAALAAMADVIGKIDAAAGAIVVAVEQQTATTHELAGNVQAVSRSTGRTAQAMLEVTGVADSDQNRASESVPRLRDAGVRSVAHHGH